MNINDNLTCAVSAMDVVYENVSQIFSSAPEGAFGMQGDVLHALMLSVFDLRNGLRLCSKSQMEILNGLASGKYQCPSGHCDEGGSRGCGDSRDCSSWGECVGGDLCCSEGD